MPDRREMNANLVGAAGFNADGDEREFAEAGFHSLQDGVVGDGGAGSFLAAGGHAGAADCVAADGGVDGSLLLLERAMDEGDVGLANLAAGKHFAELEVGGVIAGDDDEAAGLLVEAVNDTRADEVSRVGKLGVMAEEGVDEGSAIADRVSGSRAGVDHHAGGLVDHGEVAVFVDDVERDAFGNRTEWWRGGRAKDFDGFTTAQFERGLG